MARELLQTISRDENERARFRARRKFQMDMEHSLIAARDEGRSEGRNEGRNEGISEGIVSVAKNLLKRNRPIEEICEDTGLTREEIEGLRVAN